MNFDSFLIFACGVCVGISTSISMLKRNDIFELQLRMDRMESDIHTLFRRMAYKSVDKKEFERAFAELEKAAEKE